MKKINKRSEYRATDKITGFTQDFVMPNIQAVKKFITRAGLDANNFVIEKLK